MKKIYVVTAMLVSVLYFSQATGKVGVNNNAPAATLDIQPSTANLTGTTNEGILIPRLTAARVASITTPVEGTMVYVTDAPGTAAFTDTTKGFYYWDNAASKWTKMGSGAAASAATNLYTADGSLSANRTLDFNNKTLNFAGSGLLEISGQNGANVGLQVDQQTNHYGEVNMVAKSTSPTDTPDIMFKKNDGTTIARIFGTVSQNGLNFTGHDPAVAVGYSTDTVLAQPDLSILNTGEVQLHTMKQNDAENKIMVYGTNGTIQWRAASTLAGASTTASNGLTASSGDVKLGGTLTQATTVDQVNNNMTFTTGTGQFVIDGTINMQGAVYHNVRIDGSTSVNIQPTDFLIRLTNVAGGNITLPAASASTGRELCFANTGSGVFNTGALGTAGNINPGNGGCIISDGSEWITKNSY